MIDNIKQTFIKFKKHPVEYLTVSIIFAFIAYLGILLGNMFLGSLGNIIGFIFVIIPILIGLKYATYYAVIKGKFEPKLMKVGFLTYFRSIRVYLLVILKPLAIAMVTTLLVEILGSFVNVGILYFSEPSMFQAEAFIGYEEMMKLLSENELSGLIANITTIVALATGYIVFIVAKSTRNFIPYFAFEVPLKLTSAEIVNKKIVSQNHKQYFFSNVLIGLLFIIPFVIVFSLKEYVFISETLNPDTVTLALIGILLVLASPIFTLLQINNILAYKKLSKPYDDELKKEIVNVMREIKNMKVELTKQESTKETLKEDTTEEETSENDEVKEVIDSKEEEK